MRSNKLNAILIFVDFHKAFDSIHRGKMMKILKAYGIHEVLIDAISKLYENTRAKVLTTNGETDLFNIVAGVLQGDTLALFLFALVLDYAMQSAIDVREPELGFRIEQRRSSCHPPVVATDFDFADDIALVSEEVNQAQELLSRVESESAKVGLQLNAKKTELLAHRR